MLQWENPGLLDDARQSLPLKEIQKHAEEILRIETAKAQSIERKMEWEYQDFVFRELLRCIPIFGFTSSINGLHLPC